MRIEGEHTDFGSPCAFSAWLPLYVVSRTEWSTRKYARLSSYPNMVLEGDWSGIRDSDESAIWYMFSMARDELGLS